MTIKIVLPEHEGVKAGHGTRVFTSCGSEIENITRIEVDILPDSIVEATLTVAVESVENFEGIEGVVVLDSLFEKLKDWKRQEIMNRIRRGNHGAN